MQVGVAHQHLACAGAGLAAAVADDQRAVVVAHQVRAGGMLVSTRFCSVTGSRLQIQRSGDRRCS
jgi:hypothetical protein